MFILWPNFFFTALLYSWLFVHFSFCIICFNTSQYYYVCGTKVIKIFCDLVRQNGCEA